MAKLAALFGLSDRSIEVQPGYVYQRRRRDDWVEVAKVLAITDDSLGIPHVVFDLSIEHNDRQLTAMPDRRTLNLRSFQDSFRELIRSEPPALAEST